MTISIIQWSTIINFQNTNDALNYFRLGKQLVYHESINELRDLCDIYLTINNKDDTRHKLLIFCGYLPKDYSLII